jgi:hypothetical protein
MTGSIDLSVEQVRTIAAETERGTVAHVVVLRVILHPETKYPDKAVRVVTHSIGFGDVLEGHCYVLRSGERLTGLEYSQYRQYRERTA